MITASDVIQIDTCRRNIRDAAAALCTVDIALGFGQPGDVDAPFRELANALLGHVAVLAAILE